jgi:hypothetical protein
MWINRPILKPAEEEPKEGQLLELIIKTATTPGNFGRHSFDRPRRISITNLLYLPLLTLS